MPAWGDRLTARLYEAVYLRVSLINGCHYCTQHHIQGAKRAGLHPEQMKALKEGKYSGFAAPEQAAPPLCRKIDAHSRRRQRRRFRRTQETFFRRADCRSAYADRIGEPDQPRHRAPGAGSGIPGREDLRTPDWKARPNCARLGRARTPVAPPAIRESPVRLPRAALPARDPDIQAAESHTCG